jgi:predicted lipoprotein with Yx(FWY)xxD motif
VKAALLALPIAALVACGSSSTDGGGAAATATQSASSSTTSATPAPTAAPTAAPTPAAGVPVGTGSAGSVGTVLVDGQGHTLYRLTAESSGAVACTGSCAGSWPPLAVPAGQQVQSQGSLPGRFGTAARPDGTLQATYNGWPLYRYAGDTAAGTANGQGVAGKWFAVTPSQATAGM